MAFRSANLRDEARDNTTFLEGFGMLVLSRREQQSIVVGDDIQIVICRVVGRRVTIGIQAPTELKIRRGELADRERRMRRDMAKQEDDLSGPECHACEGSAKHVGLASKISQ